MRFRARGVVERRSRQRRAMTARLDLDPSKPNGHRELYPPEMKRDRAYERAGRLLL
jgi:hypothetical protein